MTEKIEISAIFLRNLANEKIQSGKIQNKTKEKQISKKKNFFPSVPYFHTFPDLYLQNCYF